MWCLEDFVKKSHNQWPSVKLFLSRPLLLKEDVNNIHGRKIEQWQNTICFSTRGVDSLYEIIKFFLHTVAYIFTEWYSLGRTKPQHIHSVFTLIWIKRVNAVRQLWHLMRKADGKQSSAAKLFHDLKVWIKITQSLNAANE